MYLMCESRVDSLNTDRKLDESPEPGKGKKVCPRGMGACKKGEKISPLQLFEVGVQTGMHPGPE